MKLNISSTIKDFFRFVVFNLIFYRDTEQNKYFLELSDALKILEQDRWSLKLSEEEKKDFLLDKSTLDFSRYNYVLENYKPISNNFIKTFESELDDRLEKYYKILTEMFGDSDIPQIDLSLICSPIDRDGKFMSAFAIKTLPRKIFLSVNEDNIKEHSVLSYVKTFLHETGHVFINNNKNFQYILKTEYLNKYKNINSWAYRNTIEELIVSTLLFSLKDFGFAYDYLGFKEDEIQKKDSLTVNKFRIMTYRFLNDLKNKKDTLEALLPKFINDMVESGAFESPKK